jgi:hypothetical protein
MANFALLEVPIPEIVTGPELNDIINANVDTVVVPCFPPKVTSITSDDAKTDGSHSLCSSPYGQRILQQAIGTLVKVAIIDCTKNDADANACKDYGFTKPSAWFFNGEVEATRAGKMFFPPKEKNAKVYVWGDEGITATVTALRVRCAFFDGNLHLRMPLVPTPAHFKSSLQVLA